MNKACQYCGLLEQEHKEKELADLVYHEFTVDGPLRSSDLRSKSLPGRAEARPVIKAPFDPILRFILMDKGIITEGDLEDAERRLRATGYLVSTPGGD